ncbi:hypothetical protein TSUD_400250 [Trifolium subterraneum]|uniref:RBR-type E3 ubiquitin transferase n=1 Tax=Trifolium subterraneum TaxID=3900 RepID=A0A2Z6NRD2_TRISU|nr:hypothetical protein TSUD_400250 [Trifolium subterraneum]
MDFEKFHLPRRTNTVPQSTPEIIDLDTYRLSGKRAISDVINLSDDEDEDDDIKILNFIPKTTQFGKRKRMQEGAAFVCEICTDTKTIKDAFFISGCSHAYCSNCVAMYIGSKLDDNITNIGCPVPECNGLLEVEPCRSILSPEVFERWDCSALLINDGTEAAGNTKCPHCNRMFCARCKVPWHNGMECSEYEKLIVDNRGKEYDKLVKLAKRKNWQRCPKCRVYVARNKGCSHMTCRCGCSFCYKCGSTYLPGGHCECHKVTPNHQPAVVQQYEQIPNTVFTGGGGIPIGGTFPFPPDYLTNTSQTPRQIPSLVSTNGVFTSGNFPFSNSVNAYIHQEQLFSRISGGFSTGGTFPFRYPMNSVQRQEHILNGVSSTGTWPYRYDTYPIRGGVSTAGTLSNRYPVIPAQPQENIFKGVVLPNKATGVGSGLHRFHSGVFH